MQKDRKKTDRRRQGENDAVRQIGRHGSCKIVMQGGREVCTNTRRQAGYGYEIGTRIQALGQGRGNGGWEGCAVWQGGSVGGVRGIGGVGWVS